MKGEPCVVSVAAHAGWAHLVCVSSTGNVPAVIERRRVTLIDSGLPRMPYEHDTIGMTEADANELIARVRRSVVACAARALQRIVTELGPGYTVVALAIRKPPFDELPETVAVVWTSHRLRNAADGVLYNLAIRSAARQLGLDVHLCPRGEETSRAGQQLRVTPGSIEEFTGGTGRPTGPPWTQEHRQAYAAGIAALATYVRALRIPTQ